MHTREVLVLYNFIAFEQQPIVLTALSSHICTRLVHRTEAFRADRQRDRLKVKTAGAHPFVIWEAGEHFVVEWSVLLNSASQPIPACTCLYCCSEPGIVGLTRMNALRTRFHEPPPAEYLGGESGITNRVMCRHRTALAPSSGGPTGWVAVRATCSKCTEARETPSPTHVV